MLRNLLARKKFKWTQVWILDQKARRYWNKILQWSECMYWVPNTMDDVYKNIDEYKQNINGKNLNAFDDMIVDIMTNKKFQALIKEVFISWRKLNISLVFIK